MFYNTERGDAYEFILDCCDMLHKLDIVYQHTMNFVMF